MTICQPMAIMLSFFLVRVSLTDRWKAANRHNKQDVMSMRASDPLAALDYTLDFLRLGSHGGFPDAVALEVAVEGVATGLLAVQVN
jgi:hypothetical protein